MPEAQKMKDRLRRRSKGEVEPPDGLAARRLLLEEIYSFFKDIASGLNHLHSQGFIHRDLKPQNCLLHDSGIPGKFPRVLVSDFGETQQTNAVRSSSGATGTVSYCAPEVLRRLSPGGDYGNFTTKSDVFSLGMTLHFMCFGNLPYAGADSQHEENEDVDLLREEITAWPGFNGDWKARSDLPDQLYRFLMRLLSLDPAQRPSAEEALEYITTGAGNGFKPGSSRHRPSTTFFEDTRSGSHISPIDSPAPSPAPGSSPTGSGRFPGRNQSTVTNGMRARGGSSRLNLQLSQERRSISPTHSPGSRSPKAGDSTPLDLDHSLILRPSRSHSRPNSPTERNERDALLAARQARELDILKNYPSPLPPSLPAPPPTHREKLLAITSSPSTRVVVKTLIFLAKLYTITQQCQPYAMKIAAAGPLLVLAAMDFTFVGGSWNVTTLLGFTHFILLFVTGKALGSRICISRIVDSFENSF
jgi:serine/threonine protein kinase